MANNVRTIWIDLDNSPHVPLFAPIIDRLTANGCRVLITVRDCFQTRALADLFGLSYRCIGRHYGKTPMLKVVGLAARSLALLPTVMRERPVLALSHGSRAQLLLSRAIGMPTILMMDYEHVRGLRWLHPTWIMAPEVLSHTDVGYDPSRLLHYPGIKEDVYIPCFTPDPRITTRLGIDGNDLIVTVRPPATEAHYHVRQSDSIFQSAMDTLCADKTTKIVLLPRNKRQEIAIRGRWPAFFSTHKIIIPDHAVDGLNLIWHSHLVISGGGTMNREAAALGVPVYSIFQGALGAVDRYLSTVERLVLIRSTSDVHTKILLRRRDIPTAPVHRGIDTLNTIINHVMSVLE